MKINILYVFWLIALGAFFLIARNLQNQSSKQLFGIAQTEGQMLKIDFTAKIMKSNVRAGMKVNKGDTLMVFDDATIEKRSFTENSASNIINVERTAKNISLEKEMRLFEQEKNADIVELEGQIRVLEQEIALQDNLKKAISNSGTSNNSLKHQEVKALQDDIAQIRMQTKAQMNLYEAERSNNNKISGSRTRDMKNELKYIDREKQKLVLLAPYDGYIEEVFVAQNEIVKDFSDLVRINPKEPNKIVGFIHESIDIQYNMGDTFTLVSATRPEVMCKAQLVGVSPKLVELPFRLRKYTEIKAWGREIYINLPTANNFFIGEKVMIQLHK